MAGVFTYWFQKQFVAPWDLTPHHPIFVPTGASSKAPNIIWYRRLTLQLSSTLVDTKNHQMRRFGRSPGRTTLAFSPQRSYRFSPPLESYGQPCIRGWCFTACHPTTCDTRRCPGMEDSGKRLPHRGIQPEYAPHVRFVVDPTLVLRHSRPCSLSPSNRCRWVSGLYHCNLRPSFRLSMAAVPSSTHHCLQI